MNIQKKRQEAQALFRAGYNCSQSVFAAFSEEIGMSREMALMVSAGLGGGVGRMREVCGAMSALAMLAGFRHPMQDGHDVDGKREIYRTVQQMAAEMRAINGGSIICRELLGLKAAEGVPQPEARTGTYYQRRPCPEIVGNAAAIACRMLFDGE